MVIRCVKCVFVACVQITKFREQRFGLSRIRRGNLSKSICFIDICYFRTRTTILNDYYVCPNSNIDMQISSIFLYIKVCFVWIWMKSGSGNYLLRIIWYNSPTEFFKAKIHITEITTQVLVKVTEMMHKNIKLLYQELYQRLQGTFLIWICCLDHLSYLFRLFQLGYWIGIV